jgi:hypothetical protein
MAEFVGPVVDRALAILQARTPALLAAAGQRAFQDLGRQFTGIAVNFPSVWVMPIRTEFDAEGSTRHQAHALTVKFAVEGSSPEDLAAVALAYMKAIDDAFTASDPADWVGALESGQVQRVFVRAHDYGPLFERGQVMARFPEMDLVVETQEL